LWLTGSAHYLKGSYRDAERVFVGVLDSDEVAASERAKAGLALEGVYEKTRRPVNQLWAAFRVLDLSNKVGVEFQDGGRDLSQVEGYGVNLDIAFLLDAQLTDTELKQYLDRYGNSPDFQFSTAGEMVQYAQAVRHARKEQFEEAAQIYSFLGFAVRADRANEAARLFAATRRPATEEARLQALYDYADFLVSNPNEIFFNDRLWSGYQRFAFTSRDDYSFPKPPADQLPRVRQFERKLQDEQEEYWRAYQILNGIVLKAGPTPLGKQAARRAVVALRRINTRFGRTPQIQAADRRLSSWLLRNESSSQSNTPAGPR
jgi:hypothetical protein